ncbi:MAG: lactam utilization protein LamB, partial [Bradyrhizobium sp.]|nr:lactam utilization protein LamB [Bradyrhizobium sp.]
FHSDTPGAFEIASAMRQTLIANGIRIAPVSDIVPQKPQSES